MPARVSHPRKTRKPIRTGPALDLSTLKLEYDPSNEVPKAKRPMGLQDAPTYWPNEKEWTDPLSYIQSIAEEGKKYGIIKVRQLAFNPCELHSDNLQTDYPTKRMEAEIQCGH